MNMIHSRS